MSAANLSGHNAPQVALQMPRHGLWVADVVLDSEVVLSGKVTLTLADLVLEGAIQVGGPSKGRSLYRVCAGAGGWGKPIPAQQEANDAGVRLSTVLSKAAAACGETMGAMPTTTIGPSWTRTAGPASDALLLLAPRAWWVDDAGITQLGARPAVAFAGTYTVTDRRDSQQWLEVASESIAALVPGAIVDGVEAVDVRHELTAAKLRTTVWGSVDGGNSRADMWRRLVRQSLPDYQFRGVTEYRVVTQVGERFDLQCVRSSLGMPDLRAVKVSPGVPGCKANVVWGSVVRVWFVNGDPARPEICGFADAESSGFAPVRLDLVGEDDTLVANPTGRVLRWGDTVNILGIPTPLEPVAPLSVSRVRA